MKLFLSYSHRDEKVKNEFLHFVRPLVDHGSVSVWDDSRIPAGGDWQQEITDALASADVAVLLVSASFLASQYCTRMEAPSLFQAREQRGLLVVPVILSACSWRMVPWLSRLKALPRDGRPLNKFRSNRDVALTGICEELAELVASRRRPPDTATDDSSSSAGVRVSERTSDEDGRYFTRDLGSVSGDSDFRYVAGPFVLTFIEAGASVTVHEGPPWEHGTELFRLNGDEFRGQLFLPVGWYLAGAGRRCYCSGHFPYGGKPLPEGPNPLPSGGSLFIEKSLPQRIVLPLADGDTRENQLVALDEASRVYGTSLVLDGDWETIGLEQQAYVFARENGW